MLLSRPAWVEAAVAVLAFSGSAFAACSRSQADLRSRVRCIGGNNAAWPVEVWNAGWNARANVCNNGVGSGLHVFRDRHSYAEVFYDPADYDDARGCCYDALEAIIFTCMDTNAGQYGVAGLLCLYPDGKCKDQYQLQMIR
ncbi:hypothetical protein BGZ63DRAFT_402914 [Mariannaea sp. PMI_226]|nr:hypothetical protein BGZ63DRAFT_402914 [Mariannaea sp. PMI_226]